MCFFAHLAVNMISLLHAAVDTQALRSVLQSDAAAAAEHYAVQASESGSDFVCDDIRVNWVQRLLAQTMGNLDQSADRFEGSLVFCRKPWIDLI